MINVLRHNVRQVAVSRKPASGPLIGYARVSTHGQDLSQQRAALREAGCSRVFEEKVSGAKRNRPELGRYLPICVSATWWPSRAWTVWPVPLATFWRSQSASRTPGPVFVR